MRAQLKTFAPGVLADQAPLSNRSTRARPKLRTVPRESFPKFLRFPKSPQKPCKSWQRVAALPWCFFGRGATFVGNACVSLPVHNLLENSTARTPDCFGDPEKSEKFSRRLHKRSNMQAINFDAQNCLQFFTGMLEEFRSRRTTTIALQSKCNHTPCQCQGHFITFKV